MKSVAFAPAALDRLADILAWTVDRFGEMQAEAYAARIVDRLQALAIGEGPKARPCDRLMRGVRESSDLVFCREGSHYLIFRERPETLEVVEIFHERMNIEAHLARLMNDNLT